MRASGIGFCQRLFVVGGGDSKGFRFPEIQNIGPFGFD
jgi:hypothetical protein